MAAWELCRARARVVMVERGGWVERSPRNWDPDGAYELTPHYDREARYRVCSGWRRAELATCSCVGGPSVFYGGVSYRFRREDFAPHPEIVNVSAARWPIGYDDLEPWYGVAERLLHIAGQSGEDPTEPPRSTPFPYAPPPLAPASETIAAAARSLGLHPSRLPLAINYTDARRPVCAACVTCDGFACAVSAKNDLATCVLPALVQRGMELRPQTVATRLLIERGRVVGAECVDRARGSRVELRADHVVLAGGALATARLLLASGLDADGLVGRYLMRHCSAIVYGVFPGRRAWAERFHKQLAITDFYFGDDDPRAPTGKLGSIQQVMTPPLGLVQSTLPPVVGRMAGRIAPLMTGLLVMAEDQPVASNRVVLDPVERDSYGVPRLVVEHRYTRRDLRARRALLRRARMILSRAGARAFYTHFIRTFSHAVGTARMGEDPESSALDAAGRLRGVEGAYVVDGSVMPTSAGVNPSLTIAAGALRMAALLTGGSAAAAHQSLP